MLLALPRIPDPPFPIDEAYMSKQHHSIFRYPSGYKRYNMNRIC